MFGAFIYKVIAFQSIPECRDARKGRQKRILNNEMTQIPNPKSQIRTKEIPSRLRRTWRFNAQK